MSQARKRPYEAHVATCENAQNFAFMFFFLIPGCCEAVNYQRLELIPGDQAKYSANLWMWKALNMILSAAKMDRMCMEFPASLISALENMFRNKKQTGPTIQQFCHNKWMQSSCTICETSQFHVVNGHSHHQQSLHPTQEATLLGQEEGGSRPERAADLRKYFLENHLECGLTLCMATVRSSRYAWERDIIVGQVHSGYGLRGVGNLKWSLVTGMDVQSLQGKLVKTW